LQVKVDRQQVDFFMDRWQVAELHRVIGDFLTDTPLTTYVGVHGKATLREAHTTQVADYAGNNHDHTIPAGTPVNVTEHHGITVRAEVEIEYATQEITVALDKISFPV
jgi:hypothetical protein